MKKLILFSMLTTLIIGVISIPLEAIAKDVYEFTISVETAPDRERNRGIQIFINELEEKSNGRFKAKFFQSAQLYKGKDILKALTLGTVEMGVPGVWWLDKINPNAALTALPMFYAQPPEVTEKLVDGEFGKELADSIEKKMNVVIPGKWYELGYVHLHTTKKEIKTLNDLKDLKIRYFGSPANSSRLQALGANPIPVPWPDMSMALMRGTVDGLITSYSAMYGAKLVDAGIKYSVMDRQYFLHYVPMCSKKFWDALPTDLQILFTEVWNRSVPKQRAIARELQKKGELAIEQLLKKKGGKIFRPSDETLAKWREHIMPTQAKLVKKLNIDPNLVETAKKMLGM
ncbi:TRAP transporter substrate-binding protein DctP [Desulfobacula sp.]|uniref:TRAP transporter substrate-binding protein DctP n=1 Tax=Desulfobacula sp. TaxID=2593537 RepID=UPI00262B5AAF|nr:TRAP transporter substrate-binding protein DctP [Desulfobacula sp.]